MDRCEVFFGYRFPWAATEIWPVVRASAFSRQNVCELGPFPKLRGLIARLASRLLPKGPEPAARPRCSSMTTRVVPRPSWPNTRRRSGSRPSSIASSDCVRAGMKSIWITTWAGSNTSTLTPSIAEWKSFGGCARNRATICDSTQFFVHTHNMVAGLLMVLQMRSSGFKAEFQPFGQDLARVLAHDEPEEDCAPQNGVLDHGAGA